MMYPVVFPTGVDGVQEIRIEVEFSWIAVRLVGGEAAVMKIKHEVRASLCIHVGTCFDVILSSKTFRVFLGCPVMRLMYIYRNVVQRLMRDPH